LSTQQPVPHKIALTGATGFVGGHVLTSLLGRGHKVRALTRQKRPVEHDNLVWIDGNLEDGPALAELVDGADTVVHIAGTIKAADKTGFFTGNVEGTRNLLAAISPDKAQPRYIHLSSLAAREPSVSDYAASKAEAEQLVTDSPLSQGATILRPPAVYGPGDMETLFYFKAATSYFATVPGKAGYRTSMVHVQDLSAAIVFLTENARPDPVLLEVHDGQKDGYTIHGVMENVAPGRRTRFNTLYLPRWLLRLVGGTSAFISRIFTKQPMLTPGKANELSHPDWVCHGTSLAEASTWQPEITGEKGMRQTLQWYREHGFLR
jgi:nucleoside-diphosphate-sugar epimerase